MSDATFSTIICFLFILLIILLEIFRNLVTYINVYMAMYIHVHVQFGCCQHKHKWMSSSPIYVRLSLEVTCALGFVYLLMCMFQIPYLWCCLADCLRCMMCMYVYAGSPLTIVVILQPLRTLYVCSTPAGRTSISYV